MPAPAVPASTSQTHDEISDENDEDEDEDEYLALTNLELNTQTSPQLNLGLEDPEDHIDLDHDLQDLSIFEIGAEYEEDTHSVVDDFRDLEDDYAAYAFDPDEVFDGEEAMANRGEVRRQKRCGPQPACFISTGHKASSITLLNGGFDPFRQVCINIIIGVRGFWVENQRFYDLFAYLEGVQSEGIGTLD